MAHYFATRLGHSLVIAGLVMLAACNQGNQAPKAATSAIDVDAHAIVAQIEEQTKTANHATLSAASNLVIAVNAFLATPDEETRATFQQSWIDAHNAFVATRALIIEPHDDMLFRIDAWPIQPGFLDSLPQYPDSGIINDTTMTIDEQTLTQQNGITDSEEVSLGFHPLEYYAFDRPIADFVSPPEGDDDSGNIERRRQALQIIAESLNVSLQLLTRDMSDDLRQLKAPEAPNERYNRMLLTHIIKSAHRTAHQGFQEANLLVSKEEEHCQFSKTSMESLAIEIETFRALFANKALMRALHQLDEPTTGNMEVTLAQTAAILNGHDTTETDRAKLPLMLSAINHQLEDFKKTLGGL